MWQSDNSRTTHRKWALTGSGPARHLNSAAATQLNYDTALPNSDILTCACVLNWQASLTGVKRRLHSCAFQSISAPLHSKKAVETNPHPCCVPWGCGDEAYQTLPGWHVIIFPALPPLLLSPNDLSIEAAVQRTSGAACRLAGRACRGRRTPGSQIADELEPITMIPVIVCGEPGIMSGSSLTTTACTHLRSPFSALLRTAWPQEAVPSRFILFDLYRKQIPEEHKSKPLARRCAPRALIHERRAVRRVLHGKTPGVVLLLCRY
jgi:hypothetical protein